MFTVCLLIVSIFYMFTVAWTFSTLSFTHQIVHKHTENLKTLHIHESSWYVFTIYCDIFLFDCTMAIFLVKYCTMVNTLTARVYTKASFGDGMFLPKFYIIGFRFLTNYNKNYFLMNKIKLRCQTGIHIRRFMKQHASVVSPIFVTLTVIIHLPNNSLLTRCRLCI